MNEHNEKMSMKEKIILCTSILAGVTGVVCLGVSVHKEHELAKLVDASVLRIQGLTEVNISDGIVNKAVAEATERETKKIVQRAAEASLESITEDVNRRVKGAVEQNLGRIQKIVADQVAKEVSKINKDEIMNEVIERAKENATQQFNAKLDSILESQNQNLENIGRIYQGIADKMSGTKTDAKGIELKLN